MRTVIVVLVLVVAACGGTETGNPFTADTRLHAHSSEASRVAVLTDGTEARVDQVWIGAGAIAMLGADCTEVIATMPAPNAGTDRAQPGPEDLSYEMTPDPLCAIAVPLVQVTDAPLGAPPELLGHSVLIAGVRTSDGTPFRIRTGLIGSVYIPELVAGMHFTIDADQPSTFLGLDVASWIGGAVDLPGATPVGGVILIEMGGDEVRLAAFEANLARGFELYDDPDMSGSATAGEAKLAKGTEVR